MKRFFLFALLSGGTQSGIAHADVTRGNLVADGKTLLALPVTLPGAAEQRFAALKCGAAWKTLDWLGFVSNARENSAFYMDNSEVENQAG